ncbi:MAG: energy transducer TonB [Bacteroidetes bacterium]|nr:energy transducer TonB [Bacteroidota bacterium]
MKKQETNKKTPLSNYLHDVIAKEKRSRNNKIIAIFFVLIAVGGGFGFFFFSKSNSETEDFPGSEMDQVSIFTSDTLLGDESGSFVFTNADEEFAEDLETSEEYSGVSSEFTDDELGNELPEERNNQDTDLDENKHEILPNYSFRVTGNQMEGEKLTFSIVNYDPRITYTMNFGNGKQKRISGEEVFTYSKSGTFQPTLVASNSRGDQSRSTRTIVIAEKERERTEVPDLQTSLNDEALNLPNKKAVDSNTNSGFRDFSEVNPSSVEPSENQVAENKPVDIEPAPREKAVMNQPLKFAEVMPAFPGGTAAMYRFLNSKLNYPGPARDNEIEGNVYVQFVVQVDGSLSQFKIVKGLGFGCDEEVIRVANLMPAWIPGTHNGRIVPVVYTLKVNFRFK